MRRRKPTWFLPDRVSAVVWLPREVLFERGVEVESQLLVLAAQGIQLSSKLLRSTFVAGHGGAFVELLVAHVSPRLDGRPIHTVTRGRWRTESQHRTLRVENACTYRIDFPTTVVVEILLLIGWSRAG
jgi:hypothetical protein